MRLTFKSATSNSCLTMETNTKCYELFSGFGSNAIMVKSNKELKQLEIELIKGGYNQE